MISQCLPATSVPAGSEMILFAGNGTIWRFAASHRAKTVDWFTEFRIGCSVLLARGGIRE
jgi:hypothetical protein